MAKWYMEIAPALIHGAFFISLVSVAALVAIWAARSPSHRLLRLAAFCALPGAMVLASAPWVAIWLLAEMLPITAVLIVGPFVARAPFGRTWLGLPKVRFDFRDLFFAIFLIAFALSAAILLSKQEYDLPRLRLWSPWIEPLSLWLPICGATVLVVGTGSRLKRMAWMVAASALGSAAWYCSIWAFEEVFHWWEWFGLRYAWWLGGLVPCLVALIVAGQLSIWRGARFPRANSSDEPSSGFRRRLWMAARLAATAILVTPACVIYYELARPVPIPPSELPTPNGYDRLVAIGRELSQQGLTPKRRDELVIQARDALRLPSLVTVNYSSQTVFDSLQALRGLARALHAEAQGQEASGDTASAVATYLDLLELGDRTERGGTYFDFGVGIAFQSMAARSLSRIVPSLSADECRKLMERIQRFEEQLEPLDDMLERQYVYARIGWYDRWFEAVETLSRTHRTRRQAIEARSIAQGWLRVLVCELSVQRYYAERGQFPDSLDQLVPAYLDAVPDDPFDGGPIKFSKDAGQYTICTTGEHLSSAARTAPTIVRQIAP
jgi:hypothetical protein